MIDKRPANLELAKALRETEGRSWVDPSLEDYAIQKKQGADRPGGKDLSARIAVVTDPKTGERVNYVVSTQGEALDEIVKSLQSGAPVVAKRLVRPKDEELAQFIAEHPLAQALGSNPATAALPPAPAPVETFDADPFGRATVEDEPGEPPLCAGCGKRHWPGEAPRVSASAMRETPSAATSAVEPTGDAPFVLRIRDGREVVREAGPFAKITDAMGAMNARGEPGQTATIYERGRVADYRGGRAVYSFGRTRWSRDA
jgi:hypothetical protein